MYDVYSKYCECGFDEKGVLNKFVPKPTENFNFGYDVVDFIAEREPEKIAVVWCNERGDEKIISFKEVSENSNRIANVLLKHGIKKGDFVMLVLKRHYQFWYAITALHKIGAVVVPATNLLTKKDYVYRFNAASVKAIICTSDEPVYQHVQDALPESPTVEACFTVNEKRDGFYLLDEEMQSASPELERIENSCYDPMLMYFTSGTTGMPKMVVHDFTYPIAHIVTAAFWHNVKPDGLHFTLAETGWGKAVWGKLYGQWFMRCAVFVYDFNKFIPSDVLHMIEKYKITTFCAPLTIYRFFIKEGIEGYDLSSLRYATTAGEAVNPEVVNKFKDLTGLMLMEGFGQTESVLQAANFVGTTPKPGSMGKPSPLYNMRIVDENDNDVPTGETGEIVIEAPETGIIGLFKGYYLNEEKTKEAWHNGLYHTGDTAWRVEDGYIWYVGRTDDIIKASGYRIGPFEIESVLIEHPAVLECAVTGAADPIRGTVIKATIVLARGYEASDELAKEIQNYVKKQTAPYKYPRIVEFVEELPKTISGKIRRVDIRKD